MYLLDTNIISELRKPIPNPNLIQWFEKTPSELLFLSVITLGEIRKGIELKKRKDNSFKSQPYEEWLNTLNRYYQDRILKIDNTIGDAWGSLMALNPNHVIDGFIAATAIVHNLVIVTRNTKDFSVWPVELLNPFSE